MNAADQRPWPVTLGSHIRFTHRACVARFQRGGGGPHGYWTIHEGGEGYTPVPGPPQGRINKTILVWPEDGDGIVIGMCRRGIGISDPAAWGHDDPGGFTALEWHDLYIVRWKLVQPRHWLVPPWAIVDCEGGR